MNVTVLSGCLLVNEEVFEVFRMWPLAVLIMWLHQLWGFLLRKFGCFARTKTVAVITTQLYIVLSWGIIPETVRWNATLPQC